MSRAPARREPVGSRSSLGSGSVVGNYTLQEVLGQGTFGEVLLAVERNTRESVAVKVLERDKIADDDARQRLANEITILHRVHHAHLLQLLEVKIRRAAPLGPTHRLTLTPPTPQVTECDQLIQ